MSRPKSSPARQTSGLQGGEAWKTGSPPLLSGLLVMAGLLVTAYWPVFGAGFIWDDNDMLTEQHLIKAADGLRRLWFSTEPIDYFPLTMTSLWLEWRLWGMNALGYHIVNLLLHGISAALFWRVLTRLKLPAPWWTAVLFAVHPVNVESVAWITERKNTLAMVFFALSVYAWVRFESSAEKPAKPGGAMRWYVLALAAFVLSLLSKTAGVMLPVVLLGLAWWRRGGVTWTDCRRTAPFFAAALGMALVTIWFQYHRAIEITVVNESTFAQRLAGAGWAVWFYLGKILVPWNLMFVYPRWEINTANPAVFLPGVAVIAALGATGWFHRRWGRSWLMAVGGFVVTLFPVLGFFDIYFHRYSFVADHWQYFSILFILAGITGCSVRWLKDKTPVFLSTITIILCIISHKQAKIYQNQGTLWQDTLAKNPACAMAESNWGLWLANQGRFNEALLHYDNALRLKPDEGTWHNSAVAALQNGQINDAVARFRKTLSLNQNHPSALMSLAWLLSINKDPAVRNGPEAVRLAERAARNDGGKDPWILDTLAAAYAEAGRFDDAVAAQQKALDLAGAAGTAPPALNEMAQRLGLYRARRPFHESP